MFVYVRGGGGAKAAVHETRSNNCQSEFSFLSLHLGSKYTFEGFANEQEMWPRIFEWKAMGFKVLKGTMSPRYICTTRNRMHKTISE